MRLGRRKIGRLLSMNYLGYFVGSLLAGAVLEVSGLDVIFCPVVIINCLCVLVTVLFMGESASTIRHQSKSNVLGLGETTTTDGDVKSKIPFRLELVKESIEVGRRMGFACQSMFLDNSSVLRFVYCCGEYLINIGLRYMSKVGERLSHCIVDIITQ